MTFFEKLNANTVNPYPKGRYGTRCAVLAHDGRAHVGFRVGLLCTRITLIGIQTPPPCQAPKAKNRLRSRPTSNGIEVLLSAMERCSDSSPSCRTFPRSRCRTSPKPPREPGCAGVDAAVPSHEVVQRLGIRLVHARVPHHAAPFAPCPFVGLGRVSRAPNDRSDRVFRIRHFQLLQAQSPASSVGFTAFRRPHGDQGVHQAASGLSYLSGIRAPNLCVK
jgi:hypothetical protein